MSIRAFLLAWHLWMRHWLIVGFQFGILLLAFVLGSTVDRLVFLLIGVEVEVVLGQVQGDTLFFDLGSFVLLGVG